VEPVGCRRREGREQLRQQLRRCGRSQLQQLQRAVLGPGGGRGGGREGYW
jgi:hypothetical protein